jgi:hypothetical protein
MKTSQSSRKSIRPAACEGWRGARGIARRFSSKSFSTTDPAEKTVEGTRKTANAINRSVFPLSFIVTNAKISPEISHSSKRSSSATTPSWIRNESRKALQRSRCSRIMCTSKPRKPSIKAPKMHPIMMFLVASVWLQA